MLGSNNKRHSSKDSSSSYHFQDLFKTAYSHGLEAIYKLESVDIKSVRPFQCSIPDPKPIPVVSKSDSIQEMQCVFDFGPEFRNWISPFVLREPVQVLALSKAAEKNLLQHHLPLLGDLIQHNIFEFLQRKGMGQGHIDEIKCGLEFYLKDKELRRTRKIDFAAWVRSLLAQIPRQRSLFVCLDHFQLSHLLEMTPLESMEIKRLTLEQRKELYQDGSKLLQTHLKPALEKDLCLIAKTLLIPWIFTRHGIASKEEIEERLERISEDPSLTHNVLHFFSDLFFNGSFPFTQLLHKIEPELYCGSTRVAEECRSMISIAATYFYKPGICYPVQELVSLILRDFARSWIGFDIGFVEKILRTSSLFNVRKGERGVLEIRMNQK